MYIFAIIFVISFIAGLFNGYHHCLAMALISLLVTILLMYNIYKVKDNDSIFRTCPYDKENTSCTSIDCKNCLNYDLLNDSIG